MTCPYSIDEIQSVLGTLPLPNPRFLATFLVGLLTCQKANFSKIAHAMPGNAKPESQQMRLRRYLDLPTLTFAPALAALLPHPAPWILAIDRTHWKHGHTDVNLLTLAVIVTPPGEGSQTAVPLLWCDLSHPGNSDTEQRIALLQQFIDLFGRQSIRFLTADREFIGGDWLAWLNEQDITFVIRIRKSDHLTHTDGTCQEAFRFFTRRGDRCRNKKQAWSLWGVPVYVGGKYFPASEKGEWLIVVSNRPSVDLFALYRHRWGIETLFQALKGRGFALEGCCSPRLERFLGLLALGYLWCLRSGMSLEEQSPRKLLRHGRPQESLFRRGLDYLHRLLLPLAGRAEGSGFVHAMLCLHPAPLPANTSS